VVHAEIEAFRLWQGHQVLQAPDAVVAMNAIREERRTVSAHRLSPTHPLDQAHPTWTVDTAQPEDGSGKGTAKEQALRLEHASAGEVHWFG